MGNGGSRRDIVAYGARLHERGFVAATDGNLSARMGDKGFLSTPTGLPKEELREEVLAVLDPEGKSLSGKPSTEWPMHYAIYRHRSDVGAVVHAHPPFATALACSGHAIERPFLSEAVISLGSVPLVPFELPSTEELADRVARTLSDHNAVLMANHGAVTVGPDVRTAFYRMETLEQTARIFLYAELLGGGRPLPGETVEHLKGLGAGYRMAELPAPACENCPVAAGEDGLYLRREELVKLLTEFGRLYPGMGIK